MRGDTGHVVDNGFHLRGGRLCPNEVRSDSFDRTYPHPYGGGGGTPLTCENFGGWLSVQLCVTNSKFRSSRVSHAAGVV